MKTTSTEYLKKLIKVQEDCTSSVALKDIPVLYTHVEGYDKEKSLYELRVFLALGKYIKDITIDVAIVGEYTHNNKRLYYNAKGNEDPEQAVMQNLSKILYENKDTINYMKI